MQAADSRDERTAVHERVRTRALHSERADPRGKTLVAPQMGSFRFAMAADSRDERTADHKRATFTEKTAGWKTTWALKDGGTKASPGRACGP